MNSASRLNNIVQFFNSVAKNEAMLTAWQRFLGLNISGSEEEVLIATQAVLAEIRIAQAKLKQIGVPEELFNETVTTLRAAFSPTQLAASWSNHSEVVTKRSVQLALQWASWSLKKFNENDIPEESIRSLQEGLDAQEAMLRDTELPDSLREMLERQVAELKVALVLYKINGVKPLVDMVNKQSGEMRHASVEMVQEVTSGPPETKSAVQKGMELIGLAAKTADSGSKIINFGKSVYELGLNALHFGQNHLPYNGG